MRVMEVVVTTGAVRCAKLKIITINKQIFTGWMPFLSHNQQCKNTER